MSDDRDELDEGDYGIEPEEYRGVLEPDTKCNAWNGKRQKYCRNPAGARTDHLGVGRCKYHGGTQPIKHGLRSRYSHHSPKLKDLLAELENDPNPRSIDEEVQLLRARLQLYLQSNPESPDIDTLVKLVGEISKSVERTFTMEAKSSVSYERIKRFMAAIDRTLEIRLAAKHPELIDRLKEDILAIPL